MVSPWKTDYKHQSASKSQLLIDTHIGGGAKEGLKLKQSQYVLFSRLRSIVGVYIMVKVSLDLLRLKAPEDLVQFMDRLFEQNTKTQAASVAAFASIYHDLVVPENDPYFGNGAVEPLSFPELLRLHPNAGEGVVYEEDVDGKHGGAACTSDCWCCCECMNAREYS